MATDQLLIHWHHPAWDSMDLQSFFTVSWLQFVVVTASITWLAGRAYQVLTKPVEELVSLLGVELPAAPNVAVAALKADGIKLQWEQPEQRSSIASYHVYLNGTSIAAVSPHDTALTISNLNPNHPYIVRITAVNAADLRAASDPIYFTTKTADSEDFFHASSLSSNLGSSHENANAGQPVVETHKAIVEANQPISTPPAMAREHSGSVSHKKGRRNSPVLAVHDRRDGHSDGLQNDEETKAQLTQKLDQINADATEAERQLKDEEADFERSKESLSTQRDQLKQSLKEKEDQTRELRKEVGRLENFERNTQNRKAKQEQQLQRKRQEREKMQKDMDLWEAKVDHFEKDGKRLLEKQETYKESQRLKGEELSAELAARQEEIKTLEDSIRGLKRELKVLEDDKTQQSPALPDSRVDGPQTSAVILEEDRKWVERQRSLASKYAQLSQEYPMRMRERQEASVRLAQLRETFSSASHHLPIPAIGQAPARHNSGRRRAGSLRDLGSGSSFGPLLPTGASSYNSSLSGIAALPTTSSPSFSMGNGTMTSEENYQPSFAQVSQEDVEQLTQGAPMSPSIATSLLPRGLLDSTNDSNQESASTRRSGSDGSDHMLPGLGPADILPGLGALNTSTEQASQPPSSPMSADSRPSSLFASPKDSMNQLPHIGTSDSLGDSDKRSVRSGTGSSRLGVDDQSRPSRFAGLVGWTSRQRGKTMGDQGPPLGTYSSQSLPRQDASSQDPIGTNRRRGSQPGNWMDQVTNRFSRSSAPDGSITDESAQMSPNQGRPSRRAFNMFGGKDVFSNHPSSPRPGSTHSAEQASQALPRPSTESGRAFGWPADSIGQRNSPLSSAAVLSNSWSRHPSRRPSVQYAGSIGASTDFIPEGEPAGLLPRRMSPTQAPIGTRPSSSQAHPSSTPPTPPKLNPQASNFVSSFFSREKKAEKAGKAKSKSKAATPEASTVEALNDLSPSESRISKDARSISTANESIAESTDSIDRVPSHAPSNSEAVSSTAGSMPKDGFFQKLSRKSSSGFKNFSTFSKEKGSLFSKKTNSSDIGTPESADEDGAVALSRSMDSIPAFAASVTSSPQTGSGKEWKENKSSGLSLKSLRRKKKGEQTPSINESMTSETGDEEDVSTPLEA